MSEPLRRQPIDLDEFERRLRSAQVDQTRAQPPQAASQPAPPARPQARRDMTSADPLAELARVVGTGAPGPQNLAQPAARTAPPMRAPAPLRPPVAPAARAPISYGAAPVPTAPREPRFDEPRFDRPVPPRPAPSFAARPTPPAAPSLFGDDELPAAGYTPFGKSAPQPQPAPSHQDSAYPGEDLYDEPAPQARGVHNAIGAQADPLQAHHAEYEDDYLQEPYPEDADVYAPPPADFDAHGRPPKKKRSFLVTAGALVVLLGGIGAAFTMRGTSGPSGTPPTIPADTRPSKVQPPVEVTSSDATPSMLDKGGADGTGPTRVVNRQEQPIDISPANRANGQTNAAGSPTSPPSGSTASAPFGEPKHVRTIAVRPDGTVISPNGGGVAAGNPSGIAALAPNNARTTGLPVSNAPAPSAQSDANAALAGSARPPIRTIATTPQPPRPQVADAAPYGANPAAAVATPKPAASTPAPKPVAAKPAPVSAPASAPAATASLNATNGNGTYAVQLAAAGSEDEAREKIASFAQKYSSALAGRRLGAKPGDSNGRTVWRVRAGGMTKEAAVQLCLDLKASGGTCFVAAN